MPQYHPEGQMNGSINGPMNGPMGGPMGGPANGQMNRPIYMGQENTDKPISFLNWLGTYALLLIPYAGWLAFITLLFVWAFSKNTPVSKKNWARANLIFTAVTIIIIVVYLIILLNSSMFQNILNGTFDYNSYYNDLFQNLK
jgi:hypothetical protein